MVRNSAKGSRILFDYYPQSVVDGDCELEVGRNLHGHLAQLGEPLLFGIQEGAAETFLASRGFSEVREVTSRDFERTYFLGVTRAGKCAACFTLHMRSWDRRESSESGIDLE